MLQHIIRNFHNAAFILPFTLFSIFFLGSCSNDGALDSARKDYNTASLSPKIESSLALNNTTVQIIFNTKLEADSITEKNLQILDGSQNPLSWTNVVVEDDKVILTTLSQSGEIYTINASNIVSKNTIPMDGISSQVFNGDALPVIESVRAVNADGIYGLKHTINIEITFSEAVVVSGTPTLLLNPSAGAEAKYESGSGSTVLSFAYTPQTGDLVSILDYADTGSLQLNGTIQDNNENDLINTLPLPGDTSSISGASNIEIDGIIPTVTLTSTPDINFTNQSSYSVSGTCSEDGRVVTVSVGGIIDKPSCSGGSFTTANLDVSPLSDSADPMVADIKITADHNDAADNDALHASSLIIKDIISPVVITIDALPTIYSGNENPYTISGTCSEDGREVTVTVDGSLTPTTQPTCTGGIYSVAMDLSGRPDSPTPSTPSVAIHVFHDDFVGNSHTADLTVIKDTADPTAAISYSTPGPYKAGTAVTITATFNEDVSDSPVPQISISGFDTIGATAMIKVSDTVYTYSYTAGAGAGTGTATIALSTAMDIAGNGVVSAPTSGANFTLDNTLPTVVISSGPSLDPVKNTATVTYSLSYTDDTSIDTVNLTNADITLNTSGATCTKNVLNGNTTSPTVQLTSCTGNGTVGITIGAGASSDTAGNTDLGAGPSTTFTVDNIAPANQDTVFAANFSAQGGSTVTIVSSGDASNEVWFAPAGTSVFTAGTDMTKASDGLSTSISAPADEGTYYLYIIDAAGNISLQSSAALTVDNTPPTIAISAPNGGADFTTTTASQTLSGSCGTDTTNITSSTGTFSDSDCSDNTWALNPVTLSEGANAITITVEDSVGNSANDVLNITLDSTPPSILSVETLDSDGNGFIDHYKITFDQNVLDSSFPGYSANALGSAQSHWLVAGYSNVVLAHGTAAPETDTVDDTVLYLAFDESGMVDTGASPDLTTTATPGLTDSIGNTVTQIITATVSETDKAKPVLILASGNIGSTALTIQFSEDVYTISGNGGTCNAAAYLVSGDFVYADNSSTDAGSITAWSDDNGCDDGQVTATLDNALTSNDQGVDSLQIASVASIYDAFDNAMSTDLKLVSLTPGVIITKTSGTTSESGTTETIGFSLTTAPTANVIISFVSTDTDEGTVSPASITFTPADYNIVQNITVTGVEDGGTIDGDNSYKITTTLTSTDNGYASIDPADIDIINLDNDAAYYFIVSSINGNTSESGKTATFTIRMNDTPGVDTTLTLSSSNNLEGTVSPTTLTFTDSNWNIDQLVTVTGVDDGAVDGDVSFTIVTDAAVGSGSNFEGIDPIDITVINEDNDIPGVAVSNISGNTSEDGGTATFSVRLNTAPTDNVTIPLSSSNTAEGTVSPASLTFTNLDYATPQTVTITGVNDLNIDGDISYTILLDTASSTDTNYNGIDPADVVVINVDNDESSTFASNTYAGTGYYKPITINTGSTGIPDSYSVKYTFDHADLVTNSKSKANGNDIRIVYSSDGFISHFQEISRVLDDSSSWNQSNTAIWFKTQAAIAADSDSDIAGPTESYRIYYSASATTDGLSDKSKAFDIYDDFTSLDQWQIWQDDGDRSSQIQSVSINPISGECTNADDANCVVIDSGGSLMGGIQHKSYNMNNNTDFIVFSKAKQSVASGELAPFIWYGGGPDDKAYAYTTSSSSNAYTGLDDSLAAAGNTFFQDADSSSGPFADADTWHEFQLHHYTDGSIKVWRDGSQQFPVLGGTASRGLKSMQSGLENISAQTTNVTINAVDTSKAFVTCSYNVGSSQPRNISLCNLTSSTNLQIVAGAGAATATVSWFVVEFASDIWVERGTINMPATDPGDGSDLVQDIDLGSAVDLSKSYILVSSNINTTQTNLDDQRMVRASFNSGTQIKIERSESGTEINVAWQVVEWDRAKVQTGTTSITDGNTFVSVTNLDYVNPETSFVIFNFKPGPNINGVEEDYFVRSDFSSSTLTNKSTINFYRYGPDNQVDIGYFLIDLGDGSKVEHGSLSLLGTDLSTTTTLSTVNTALAFPLISNDVNAANDATALDPSLFYADYLDSTTLRVTRGDNENKEATVNYSAIEFASWSAADLTIESGKFALGGKSPSNELYSFDWVKVRKFVNPEPWVIEGSETGL